MGFVGIIYKKGPDLATGAQRGGRPRARHDRRVALDEGRAELRDVPDAGGPRYFDALKRVDVLNRDLHGSSPRGLFVLSDARGADPQGIDPRGITGPEAEVGDLAFESDTPNCGFTG